MASIGTERSPAAGNVATQSLTERDWKRASNNNQFVGGRRNPNYVSPTMSSNIFYGAPEAPAAAYGLQSARSPQQTKVHTLNTQESPAKSNVTGVTGKSRKNLYKPDDHNLFSGPLYSPQREITSARISKADSNLLRNNDVCFNCSNEKLAQTKRQENELNRQMEREYEAQTLRSAKDYLEGEQRKRFLEREQKKTEYEHVKQNLEKKRHDAIEAKKDTSGAIKPPEPAYMDIAAQKEYQETLQKYRSDLDHHSQLAAENKNREKDLQLALEKQHVGLPLGQYNPDHRKEVMETLQKQIDHKQKKIQEERQKDVEYSKQVEDKINRLRAQELSLKAKDDKSRIDRLGKIVEDMKELEHRKQEKKAQEELDKRTEREHLNAYVRSEKEREIKRKQDIQAALTQGYTRQMEEKKQKMKQQKEEEHRHLVSASGTKTPALSHRDNCVNCQVCRRKMNPTSSYKMF